jgi:alpha-1,6-mannosyltransferase
LKIYLLFLGYVFILFFLGYFIPRHEFLITLVFFGICFLFYFWICLNCRHSDFSILKGLLIAFFFRTILMVSVPSLSDDCYRYFFDGQLLNSGINPYLMTPSEIMNSKGPEVNDFLVLLFSKMNSQDYFSVYPPVHQFFFYIASFGGQSLFYNILILRLVIISFDFLNMYLLYKILFLLDKPISNMWWYAFNPLIILELTGNLHLEGIVLTGILTFIFFWINKKPMLAALGWSWAIGIKLTPLMLGPLFLFSWKKEKSTPFLIFSAILIALLFSPLLISDGSQKIWQSMRLFQSTFEFNGSIYNIVKWFSGFFVDYNPIAYVGPFLNLIAFLAIAFYCIKINVQNYEKLLLGIIHVYLIYLLTQNVVHPWYIIPAFGVSLLTNSKIFLIWTGLVFLSYHAYSNEDYTESAFLIGVEYSILLVVILFELFYVPKPIINITSSDKK